MQPNITGFFANGLYSKDFGKPDQTLTDGQIESDYASRVAQDARSGGIPNANSYITVTMDESYRDILVGIRSLSAAVWRV